MCRVRGVLLLASLFGCSFCAVAVSIAFAIFCAHAALSAAPDDREVGAGRRTACWQWCCCAPCVCVVGRLGFR